MYITYYYPTQDLTDIAKINNPENIELFKNIHATGIWKVKTK